MKLTTLDRKKFRIRNKLKKFSDYKRLRLSVSRTSKNISAQIIDDSKNTTIVSASSNQKSIKSLNKKNKSELSEVVAESLAKKGKGITPILSVAPKDHHSVLQLYLDGPRDKFFTFFSSSNEIKKYKITDKIIPNSTTNNKN